MKRYYVDFSWQAKEGQDDGPWVTYEDAQAAIAAAVLAERAQLLEIVRAYDTGDMTREDLEARRIIQRLEARSSKP